MGQHSDDFPEEMQMFVQPAHDYGVTGSRLWTDLSGSEQDAYLFACFAGEDARAKAEREFDLFDRVASSIADGLLATYRQRDPKTGGVCYQPESAERVEKIIAMRQALLADSPLGERLRQARRRQRLGPSAANSRDNDTPLPFEGFGPETIPGLVSLTESAVGGITQMSWYTGKANDWDALDLQLARDWQVTKEIRHEEEMEAYERELKSRPPVAASVMPAPTVPAPQEEVERVPAPPDQRFSQLLPVGLGMAALLLWALHPENPYGYYVLLRWLTCAGFLYLCMWFDRLLSHRAQVVAVICAFLYNPVFPLSLGREIWTVINIATVAVLLWMLGMAYSRSRHITKLAADGRD